MAHHHAHQADYDTHVENPQFDPVDPHGQHERIHHHIYSWQFLTGVLFILLFFTFLTIVVSDAESWLVKNIAITIPDFVNVLIAMSIATVKAMFVVMYFMGLRRGNPLNAMIFLFTLFAFGLFIGLTAIDLGNRGQAYTIKAREIVPGGSGYRVRPMGDPQSQELTGPIYLHARETVIANKGETYWKEHYAEKKAKYATHGPERSTPNIHIRRTGLTPGLFDHTDPAESTHGDQGEH